MTVLPRLACAPPCSSLISHLLCKTATLHGMSCTIGKSMLPTLWWTAGFILKHVIQTCLGFLAGFLFKRAAMFVGTVWTVPEEPGSVNWKQEGGQHVSIKSKKKKIVLEKQQRVLCFTTPFAHDLLLLCQTWRSPTRTLTGSFPLLVRASVFKICLKALFVKPPVNPAKTPDRFFSLTQDLGALFVCLHVARRVSDVAL